MSSLRFAIGDYGGVYPFNQLKTIDNQRFSGSELAGASYTFFLYVNDYLRLPMQPADTQFYVNNTSVLKLYRVGNLLNINGEIMVINAVDPVNGVITVNPRLSPLDHPGGAKIKNVVYISLTAVSYDSLRQQVIFTHPQYMVQYPGRYWGEFDFTVGARKATVQSYDGINPWLFEAVEDINGG